MRIIKSFAASALIFFLCYLLGAFVAVSFDITKWADIGRFMVAIFGGFASAITFAFVFEDLK